jgi:hypothetical protein
MSTLETKFNLTVPHHTYIVDDIDPYDFNNHLDLYMNKYKENITNEERIELNEHLKYVRVMSFQDSPNSSRYIKCYCRNISEMIESHKKEADLYFKAAREKYKNIENLILVEVNYATMGYFYLYKLD